MVQWPRSGSRVSSGSSGPVGRGFRGAKQLPLPPFSSEDSEASPGVLAGCEWTQKPITELTEMLCLLLQQGSRQKGGPRPKGSIISPSNIHHPDRLPAPPQPTGVFQAQDTELPAIRAPKHQHPSPVLFSWLLSPPGLDPPSFLPSRWFCLAQSPPPCQTAFPTNRTWKQDPRCGPSSPF